MTEIFSASVEMLFSCNFWEYGFFAFSVFFLFSIIIRFIIRRQDKPNRQWKFYLVYPFLSLLTVIPAVVIYQFSDVLHNIAQNDNKYALIGLGLNITAYFILNIIIGLFWTVFTKIMTKFEER